MFFDGPLCKSYLHTSESSSRASVGAAVPAKGVYRIRHPLAAENGVWVSDGVISIEITETMYRARGYSPTLELLPWRTQNGEQLQNENS